MLTLQTLIKNTGGKNYSVNAFILYILVIIKFQSQLSDITIYKVQKGHEIEVARKPPQRFVAKLQSRQISGVRLKFGVTVNKLGHSFTLVIALKQPDG